VCKAHSGFLLANSPMLVADGPASRPLLYVIWVTE
jgi:hypothetical protein